jgi:hypothetical protein
LEAKQVTLTALKKLIESSKANVLVAVLIILAVLLYLGNITDEQFLSTVKVLVPSWFLAHAGESGAKAIAEGKPPKEAVKE